MIIKSNMGQKCRPEDSGVDLNRNYGVSWGINIPLDPCDECFNGRGPFSEPETRAVRDFMTSHKN